MEATQMAAMVVDGGEGGAMGARRGERGGIGGGGTGGTDGGGEGGGGEDARWAAMVLVAAAMAEGGEMGFEVVTALVGDTKAVVKAVTTWQWR